MLALSLVAAVLVAGGAARADYDETEARLKSAGIDAELRAEIHASIDRGVEFLGSAQRPDGGFGIAFSGGGPGKGGTPILAAPESGRTVLCALALRHAGTPAAMETLAKARRLLFAGGPSAMRASLEGSVYESGIAAMLVAADGGPRPLAKVFANRLLEAQGPSGYWGYGTSGVVDVENLSTTQFGALGLWAAARTGVEVPEQAWSRLATSHVKWQAPKGGWAYRSGGATSHYLQGTFMGLADLLLAEAALRRLEKPPEALLARVAKAKERGLEALDRDGAEFLVAFEKGSPLAFFPYYSLYALEKACLFADVETLNGVRWYERGARALIGRQREDGGWGAAADATAGAEDDRVATAFALLFLLRSSATYHPTTPRDPDAKPAPAPQTTPSEPDPKR